MFKIDLCWAKALQAANNLLPPESKLSFYLTSVEKVIKYLGTSDRKSQKSSKHYCDSGGDYDDYDYMDDDYESDQYSWEQTGREINMYEWFTETGEPYQMGDLINLNFDEESIRPANETMEQMWKKRSQIVAFDHDDDNVDEVIKEKSRTVYVMVFWPTVMENEVLFGYTTNSKGADLVSKAVEMHKEEKLSRDLVVDLADKVLRKWNKDEGANISSAILTILEALQEFNDLVLLQRYIQGIIAVHGITETQSVDILINMIKLHGYETLFQGDSGEQFISNTVSKTPDLCIQYLLQLHNHISVEKMNAMKDIVVKYAVENLESLPDKLLLDLFKLLIALKDENDITHIVQNLLQKRLEDTTKLKGFYTQMKSVIPISLIATTLRTLGEALIVKLQEANKPVVFSWSIEVELPNQPILERFLRNPEPVETLYLTNFRNITEVRNFMNEYGNIRPSGVRMEVVGGKVKVTKTKDSYNQQLAAYQRTQSEIVALQNELKLNSETTTTSGEKRKNELSTDSTLKRIKSEKD